MPCSECGHLLYVDYDNQKLRCPQCRGLDLEDPDILAEKVENARDKFNRENLIQLIQDYSKEHLLLHLISRLNHIANQFYETRGIPLKEFSYLNYLIKSIYDQDDFGESYLDTGFDESAEEIDALLDAQAELINALNHVEENFRFCVPWPVEMPSSSSFFGEYWILDSEYRLCYHRCIRSLIGGSREDHVIFDWTSMTIRDFNRPAGDEINSLRDYADCFYELIASMKFMAAANETVGDIYTTFIENTTVFDIKNFIECLDTQFDNRSHAAMRAESIVATPSEALVDICGERAFGDNWDTVKEQILISENNLDAHPFLFEIEHEEIIKRVPGRDPLTRTKKRIIYPKFYDLIIRIQLFPLLRNGQNNPSGHDLLTDVTASRGKQFERNIHEYLTALGYESYHSAELLEDRPAEIDVLVVTDEELWFIECKYLMPKLSMNATGGIEEVNAAFDHYVFKEDDGYSHSPTGDPFDEKVGRWLELEGDTEFRTQVGSDEDNTEQQVFQPEWLNLNTRMMVVSNLVPSYVEKRGVEFLTDVEFIEFLEGDFDRYEVIH